MKRSFLIVAMICLALYACSNKSIDAAIQAQAGEQGGGA